MFGHKWEPAHGTIAGVDQPPLGGRHLVYLVDVQTASGAMLRARVTPPRWMSPDLPPGTQVQVEVNGKTGEVRFGSQPVDGFSPGAVSSVPPGPGAPFAGTAGPGSGSSVTVSSIDEAVQVVRGIGGQAAGDAVAQALAGLAQGLPGTGTPHVRVVSQPPDVQVVSGAQAAELMREFLGDGGAQAAAFGQAGFFEPGPAGEGDDLTR